MYIKIEHAMKLLCAFSLIFQRKIPYEEFDLLLNTTEEYGDECLSHHQKHFLITTY